MGRTPSPAGGQNIETITYNTPSPAAGTASLGGSRASYTPVGGPSPTETASNSGRSGGRANAQGGTVPSLVVGGSSESVAPPGMPGTLRVGENKNVSTPVTG